MPATQTTPPTPRAMYAALVASDARFDGVFFVGVTTTGVFCRPSCRARKPRRENVVFFADEGEAIRAGFRACLRCRPLQPVGEPPPWARRLLAEVARPPRGESVCTSERISDAALASRGIDPRRARRWFLAHRGMTFQAYQRAHRLGAALGSLAQGAGVLEAGLSNGYDSASGFASAVTKTVGRPPGRARDARPLVARWLPTPLGQMLAVASPDGLAILEFSDRRALERELQALRGRWRSPVLPGSSPTLDRVADELGAWFSGSATGFQVPLAPIGTEFQRRVWDRLARIPFGETASYAQVAADVGRPAAVRAVGAANGANPLAIVVPCHRVVRSDGSLCGYGGGLWRKQWLLDHERRVAAALLAASAR